MMGGTSGADSNKRGEALLLTLVIAMVTTIAGGIVAGNARGNIACKEQFGRVAAGKNIPADAALTFNRDPSAPQNCTVAWINANGVKESYSWDPVENVVAFPADATIAPAR